MRRARSGMWKRTGSALGGRWMTMRLSRRQERMSRSGAIIVAAALMLVPARAVADVSAQGVGDATQAVDGATQAVGDAVGDATQAVDDATQAVGGAVDDATQAVGDATRRRDPGGRRRDPRRDPGGRGRGRRRESGGWWRGRRCDPSCGGRGRRCDPGGERRDPGGWERGRRCDPGGKRCRRGRRVDRWTRGRGTGRAGIGHAVRPSERPSGDVEASGRSTDAVAGVAC